MASKYKKYSAEIQNDLMTIFHDCIKEDSSVRERQIRKWKRLKLLWENFQQIWYSEVAHDWRIWDDQEVADSGSDQAYYDKPINVLRAYCESIIAALSVVVPSIKNYPEDATNPQDLATARASDKIAELICRHNDVGLLWLHALYIYATEGMVACYNYPESDKEYGTYEEKEYEEKATPNYKIQCPDCGHVVDEGQEPLQTNGPEICPNCNSEFEPEVQEEVNVEEVLKDIKIMAKTRVCMESYGGLYVKISNFAKCQKDIPYLNLSIERDRSYLVKKYYDDIDDDCLKSIQESSRGSYDMYGMWGRLSPQYYGEYPTNAVTENTMWIRPCKFYSLKDKEQIDRLVKAFPDGVKICVINDKFIYADPECLDKHWTLTSNPMSDYLMFEPMAQGLVPVQDITNDLVSLVLQTIEHGIGQTFVSPDVLSLEAYSQTETTPGGIYTTKPLGNKKIGDGFFELKTASLGGEVLPFTQQIQSLGQLASGALPSLFGGQLEGSDTASEYSMSRSQALQRQQNVWKVFTSWWKGIMSKSIPMFIANMKTDEKDVQLDANNNFINVVIEKSELNGKVGKVELESSENLPMTWGQRADKIEKLLTNGNPELVSIISAPENRTLLHEYLGMADFYVPGEDDIIKQYDEIQQLLASEPITNAEGAQVPSVEIDPVFDNHEVEFEIVRKWVIGEEGRLAKITNEKGYHNVLLHGILHFEQIQMRQQQQMLAAQPQMAGKIGNGANPEKPKEEFNRTAPITGDNNVATVQ